jgi:cbb3-type cytochrome oxidase subunit 3
MIGVGNVGMSLAPYVDSDTFLTRDGGFTWEEIHKDAHLWEFGDQGSILILANDEEATDHVLYTLNEGFSWQQYSFGTPIKVRSIVTVPSDTSRKFILFGYEPRSQEHTVAIHIDMSKITNRKCVLDLSNPNGDDFTLWSPSEQREEKCLFGKTTLYHRRIRDKNCYIGETLPQPFKEERICECTADDFECEFNHVRNGNGDCVLVPGAQALASDSYCAWGQDKWYERTAYRKVPHSKCVGGLRLDRGTEHACRKSHGFFWWVMVIVVCFLFAGLFAFWYARRRGAARKGRIRLPDPNEDFAVGGSRDSPLERIGEHLSSVPWFLFGIVGQMKAWVSGQMPRSRTRGGYRTLPLDDDGAFRSMVVFGSLNCICSSPSGRGGSVMALWPQTAFTNTIEMRTSLLMRKRPSVKAEWRIVDPHGTHLIPVDEHAPFAPPFDGTAEDHALNVGADVRQRFWRVCVRHAVEVLLLRD